MSNTAMLCLLVSALLQDEEEKMGWQRGRQWSVRSSASGANWTGLNPTLALVSGVTSGKSPNISRSHLSLLRNKENRIYQDKLLLGFKIIIYLRYVNVQTHTHPLPLGTMALYLLIQHSW